MSAFPRDHRDLDPGHFRQGGWVITRTTFALAIALLAARAGAEPADQPHAWARTVALLQYIAEDYPAAVASQDEFELDEQVELMREVTRSAAGLGEKARPLLPRVRAVEERIARHADPAGVQRDARSLADAMMATVGLRYGPPHPPNVPKGEALFNTHCAACHGTSGRGDGPAAAALKPAPANLVASGLTPYRVFNAASFGVPGTAMQGFSSLSPDERWDVAFYVLSIGKAACSGLPRQTTLESLAAKTDAELVKAHGAAQLACLRRAVPESVAPGSVRVARERVLEAKRAALAGKLDVTRDVLLDAYIFEIESVEPMMWARDAELVKQLELAFAQARAATEQEPQRVGAELDGITRLLDRALKVVSR